MCEDLCNGVFPLIIFINRAKAGKLPLKGKIFPVKMFAMAGKTLENILIYNIFR